MMLENTGPSRNRRSRAPVERFLLDDLCPRDVRRHQVRRELDAAERQVQRACQRADHQRLGQPRNAFQQAVSPAKQRDQQLLDHLLLAHNDLTQLLDNLLARLLQAVKRR
jgi:hypothetical protein